MLPTTIRVAPPHVGRPIAATCIHGALDNRTIRVQLDELQSPVAGRKCSIKDRRPLDPPPVVQVRLFEVTDIGTEHELVDLSDRIAFEFVCFVDLFSLASGDTVAQAEAHTAGPPMAPYTEQPFDALAGPSLGPLPLAAIPGQIYQPNPTDCASPAYPIGDSDMPPPFAFVSLAPNSAIYTRSAAQTLDSAEGAPMGQGVCYTPSLVGTSVVSVSCHDLDGRPALLGVFHDLAVNITGRFMLRYRAANMLWCDGPTERPVVAECWSDPFDVYPANLFPGLRESTDLTKHLSRSGVPVNVRQNERKKRKNQSGRKRMMRRLEKASSPD